MQSTVETPTPPPSSFAPGGYRYLKSVFQFSGGVVADEGFAIERVRLARPLALEQGLDAIESHLARIGRPIAAFCACELRSPAPFTEEGFVEFNRRYVARLERWGVYRDGDNPVARTNVCPDDDPPAVPSLHAFSYTVPATTSARTFIVAGGAEAHEGRGDYRDSIVRLGDTSLDGLREKLRFVRDEQQRRLVGLGLGWGDVLSTQVYTRHDVGPLLRDELLAGGAAPGGLVWHLASPPVVDCEFEMDARAVAREVLL
jgi:hypothetical protein